MPIGKTQNEQIIKLSHNRLQPVIICASFMCRIEHTRSVHVSVPRTYLVEPPKSLYAVWAVLSWSRVLPIWRKEAIQYTCMVCSFEATYNWSFSLNLMHKVRRQIV
jgi:hypothetical protein